MAGATWKGKKERQELKLERYAEAKGRTETTWRFLRPFTISKIDILAIKVTFVCKVMVIDKPVIL